MEGSSRPRRRLALIFLSAGLILLLPLLLASHWYQQGWRDKHIGYPPVPSGYTGIVNVFGQPCNSNASLNWMTWRAADNGLVYQFRFHKKLGGMATEMVSGKGGTSTNLDNDVYGHIRNQHLDPYVKSGIWGYVCRYIAGTTIWSTHAWGIAIDVSSKYEPFGQCYSTTNYHHASIWQNHGWTWLNCDRMHFQYAVNY